MCTHKRTYKHACMRSRCADSTTPIILQISLIMARWIYVCMYIGMCTHKHAYTQANAQICIHAPTWRGEYDLQAPSNYRSLLQNIVCFIGLFCKRDYGADSTTMPLVLQISPITTDTPGVSIHVCMYMSMTHTLCRLKSDWRLQSDPGLESYGVATICRLLQIIGLFCRI